MGPTFSAVNCSAFRRRNLAHFGYCAAPDTFQFMNYWLNLFTGTTWKEFQAAGAKVSGFRQHNWKRAENIKPGDVFLCYMVGVERWVGLLEITSERFLDESKVFGEEVFPVRFKVKPIVMLKAEHGIPMEDLAGKLTFYAPGVTSKQWSGYVRSSPAKYRQDDGTVIAGAVKQAAVNPVARAVDPKQLARSANLYKLKTKAGNEEIEAVVSVPSVEDDDDGRVEAPSPGAPTHSEIQYRLLDLGSQMGLTVWAPKSDRGRTWNGRAVGAVPRMLDGLPTQFDKVTNKTIENINVSSGLRIRASLPPLRSSTRRPFTPDCFGCRTSSPCSRTSTSTFISSPPMSGWGSSKTK